MTHLVSLSVCVLRQCPPNGLRIVEICHLLHPHQCCLCPKIDMRSWNWKSFISQIQHPGSRVVQEVHSALYSSICGPGEGNTWSVSLTPRNPRDYLGDAILLSPDCCFLFCASSLASSAWSGFSDRIWQHCHPSWSHSCWRTQIICQKWTDASQKGWHVCPLGQRLILIHSSNLRGWFGDRDVLAFPLLRLHEPQCCTPYSVSKCIPAVFR